MLSVCWKQELRTASFLKFTSTFSVVSWSVHIDVTSVIPIFMSRHEALPLASIIRVYSL